MLNHESLRKYFNYQHPTPHGIRERYELSQDLSSKHGLTHADILDAIMTLNKNRYLVLPDSYERHLLEAEHPDHPEISLDNYRGATKHFHFWRYAPDVKLNTTEMSLEDAEKQRFSLKAAMRVASWNWTKPHRGFGVVDVRSGEYTLWPFLYILEGIKMQDLSPGLIHMDSTEGFDVVGRVPRLRGEGYEVVALKNVPYLYSGEPYVLSTQLHPVCQCKWILYGARRADTRRYRPGERTMCRHGVAFYEHLIEDPKERVLDGLPHLTGIINPWWVLKQKTILNGKKLTVTRMDSLIGMLIGFMGVKKAFDLS